MMEQEIKLSVAGSQPLDLHIDQRLGELRSGPVQQQRMLTSYYDTPGWRLLRDGVFLRLRKAGDQWLQTVKTSGEVKDGLHQRQEWETPLHAPEFDLALLRQTPLRPIIEDEGVWAHVDAVFVTDFEREIWPLKLADGTEIELAYDVGEVRTLDRQTPIHEIELELVSGDVEKLQQLAAQLQADWSLVPAKLSKAALGYRLNNAPGFDNP